MGIMDLFKKKQADESKAAASLPANNDAAGDDNTNSTQSVKGDMTSLMAGVDTSKMTTMQKMAFKMFKRLSPDKQQQVLRQAMNPQNLQKNKAEILKQIDEMVKSGQIDKGQAESIKSQMGLR